MKENKLVIVINRPVEEIFEFTLNPKNTHLWIPSIKKEVSDEYPPKIGTIYKNVGIDGKWNYYSIIEFEENKTFTLKGNNYFVRYTFKKLGNNKTELIYYEWVESGEIESPFTEDILLNLKELIEK